MKRSTILTCLVVLGSNARVVAQYPPVPWAYGFGASSQDFGRDVVLDPAGNTVALGDFFGTVDGDPGVNANPLVSAGGADIYVVKLDPQGQHVWSFRLGSTAPEYAAAIATDAQGNVFVTGLFSGATDFDPGPGTVSLTNVGDQDIFILKLDADGIFQWVRHYGGPYSDEVADMVVDPAGNVLVTGLLSGTVDMDPGPNIFNLDLGRFLVKLDPAGDLVWAEKPLVNAEAFGMCSDAAGAIYLVGRFGATSDFDPGPDTAAFTAVGSVDIFVSKLDANGAFVWARAMGGPNDDKANAVAVDTLGNVFVTGMFRDSCNFDPGVSDFTLTTVGNIDVFTMRLNADGSFAWAFRIGGATASTDEGYGIAVDAVGHVYTTGELLGTSDMDPGPGTFTLSTGSTTALYVQCVGTDAAFHWAFKVSAGSFYYNSGRAIVVDGTGNARVTGCFEFINVDFDPGAAVLNLSAAGIDDAFVMAIGPAGPLGLEGMRPEQERSVLYPDPAHGQFVLGCNTDRATLELLDAVGRVVFTAQLHQGLNTVDVPTHLSGMFACRLRDGVRVIASDRLVLQ